MSSTPTPGCGDECVDALERLEAFLDGELSASDVEPVKRHLGDCSPCADRASFEEQVRELVRRRCLDAAPPELRERVRARLHADSGS